MFNEVNVVVVSAFQGEKKTDTHGATNVWLTPVAGKIPNTAMVVAGTVAEKAGLEVGKTLLVMVNEGAEREVDGVMRRQFNHTVLGEVKPLEIISLRKTTELGPATIVDTAPAVNAPAANTIPTMATSNLGTAAGATSNASAEPAANLAEPVE